MKLFALKSTKALGQAVAGGLGISLAACEERLFEDGEAKVRPLENVAGENCFVVHSLFGSANESTNDKLCNLLFFAACLKDHGASKVTAVVPYLCYARKDRRTKSYDPVTMRYVAALVEAAGINGVMALDVHNPAAFENAFRCRTISLTATSLFIEHLRPRLGNEQLCVVSPDPGGVKRAELFREALERAVRAPVGKGFVDKHRSSGVLTGDLFAGDASGAAVIIIDDLVSTGHTLVRAAKAVRRAGAQSVCAIATHALFTADSQTILADPAIDRLMITDSVTLPILAPELSKKLDIVPVAEFLAGAIRNAEGGQPMEQFLGL